MTKPSPGRPALATFLDDPARPPETLRYHELQGFLFAVAGAPETVMPSEWIPEIFGSQEAAFKTLDEAQAILPELMALYNAVNASVLAEPATLPEDCQFRKEVMANFDEDAPISQWARGFLHGYQWLREDWDAYVPDEFDQDFGAMLMLLTFFASRSLATSYMKEIKQTHLGRTAKMVRDSFPEALAEYARIGRAIHKALIEHEANNE